METLSFSTLKAIFSFLHPSQHPTVSIQLRCPSSTGFAFFGPTETIYLTSHLSHVGMVYGLSLRGKLAAGRWPSLPMRAAVELRVQMMMMMMLLVTSPCSDRKCPLVWKIFTFLQSIWCAVETHTHLVQLDQQGICWALAGTGWSLFMSVFLLF